MSILQHSLEGNPGRIIPGWDFCLLLLMCAKKILLAGCQCCSSVQGRLRGRSIRAEDLEQVVAESVVVGRQLLPSRMLV